jgi:alpha-glucosidase (family GH31 glycosyl hydrolase)
MRDHLGPKRMSTPNAVDMWTNADTVDTWRRYAHLHNALVAYFYAYARIAHETGVPTMRHMVLESPDQPEALQQDYQYLLGHELLVAPVVEPGAITRRVWLPDDAWFSFWDDTRYDGPGYVDVPAPIEQIPLLVRGGAIIPLIATPVVSLANVAPEDLLTDLELRIYPTGESGESIFTFHDGSTVHLEETTSGLTISLEAIAATRRIRLRLPATYAIGSVTAGDNTIAYVSSTDSGTFVEIPAGTSIIRIGLAT